MDQTRRVHVQRATIPGASFGSGGRPGTRQGQHDPGIKEGWQAHQSAQTTSDRFNQGYNQAGGTQANLNRGDRTQKASATYGQAAQAKAEQLVRNTSAYGIKQLKKRTKVTKVIGLQRLKVTTANTWIGSWAMFWYLTFQLPLAVISAAGLGMAYAVNSYINSIKESSIVAGWVVSGLEKLADVVYGSVSEALKAITKLLFGIDFDPMLLFITPFALIFLLGLFQLILTWFVYSAMRINSLSGRAGGIKGLMFVLAGVGYAIPILNLFPLIFLWMIVVWIHPK